MHNGDMLDITHIAKRLQAYSPSSQRGDHDLNPHFRINAPLRPAAVLVGLVDRPEGLSVLLTRRTEHLEHHPGQISFPGGHIEARDADPIAAALRETFEETGITPQRVRVLGRLDDYVTRTGFHVTPVVGVISPPFDLAPDSHEVEEVFEVPLSFFLDPANHHFHERHYDGALCQFYAMAFGDYYIWGATAGMLINLYGLLGASPMDDTGAS